MLSQRKREGQAEGEREYRGQLRGAFLLLSALEEGPDPRFLRSEREALDGRPARLLVQPPSHRPRRLSVVRALPPVRRTVLHRGRGMRSTRRSCAFSLPSQPFRYSRFSAQVTTSGRQRSRSPSPPDAAEAKGRAAFGDEEDFKTYLHKLSRSVTCDLTDELVQYGLRDQVSMNTVASSRRRREKQVRGGFPRTSGRTRAQRIRG